VSAPFELHIITVFVNQRIFNPEILIHPLRRFPIAVVLDASEDCLHREVDSEALVGGSLRELVECRKPGCRSSYASVPAHRTILEYLKTFVFHGVASLAAVRR
jgi:hypothetical protein